MKPYFQKLHLWPRSCRYSKLRFLLQGAGCHNQQLSWLKVTQAWFIQFHLEDSKCKAHLFQRSTGSMFQRHFHQCKQKSIVNRHIQFFCKAEPKYSCQDLESCFHSRTIHHDRTCNECINSDCKVCIR